MKKQEQSPGSYQHIFTTNSLTYRYDFYINRESNTVLIVKYGTSGSSLIHEDTYKNFLEEHFGDITGDMKACGASVANMGELINKLAHLRLARSFFNQ